MSSRLFFLFIVFLALNIAYGFSQTAATTLMQQNELLQSVIDQNTSFLQNGLTTNAESVNTSVWKALCPNSQTLDSVNGCQPDCTGDQAGACQLILAATQILPLFSLPTASENSIIVFSLTPDSTVVNTGPTLTPPLNGAFAHCMAVLVTGERVLLVPNTISPGRSLIRAPSLTDTAFLATGGSSVILPIYAGRPTTNQHYSGSSNTYYIICVAFTVLNHIPYSANATGISCSWD